MNGEVPATSSQNLGTASRILGFLPKKRGGISPLCQGRSSPSLNLNDSEPPPPPFTLGRYGQGQGLPLAFNCFVFLFLIF